MSWFSMKDRSLDADAQALRWYSRHSLQTLSSLERAALERWLADPAHRAAWDRIDAPARLLAEGAAASEMLELRSAALAQIAGHAGFRLPYLAAIAAALILVLIGTWALLPLSSDGMGMPVTRYATRIGEHRSIQIADGSILTLNTGTILEVRMTAERREVRLLKGQALFKVAKDPSRPFDVLVADRRITALGTMFDVRLDTRQRISVLLAEGSVEVAPLRLHGLRALVPSLSRERLTPGERLSTTDSGLVEIVNDDVERDLAWRKGQMIFRDDPLSLAVNEMNRFTTRQLLIDDPRIAALPLSGVFSTDRPDDFIAAITAFYPLKTEGSSPGLARLSWRDEAKNHPITGHTTKE